MRATGIITECVEVPWEIAWLLLQKPIKQARQHSGLRLSPPHAGATGAFVVASANPVVGSTSCEPWTSLLSGCHILMKARAKQPTLNSMKRKMCRMRWLTANREREDYACCVA